MTIRKPESAVASVVRDDRGGQTLVVFLPGGAHPTRIGCRLEGAATSANSRKTFGKGATRKRNNCHEEDCFEKFAPAQQLNAGGKGNSNILDVVQDVHRGVHAKVVNLASPFKSSISGWHNKNNASRPRRAPPNPCPKITRELPCLRRHVC